ncbi:TAXI family TRAP transporter solute-binding subunit [Bacillus solimangrovi]|uniref:C4-dicarboxylate ABC transporter substrate-binding protein n=1 Tax=Bacillus solimangrovi TaxID=1305675 RepID=A0A1E5LD30_9BACI|nr:TAXI family TRAP transporter solute-binding subunit [Bacillus solimangrovi]OEH91997.1 C4-dicarboxylate ABC transporter substrate-binding protein [Bacillus solimangrovi]
MKKLLSIMVLSILLLAACSGGNNTTSGNGESASEKGTNIVFGTGGTSGTYYPIGGALKSVFEESDLISNVTVESTGASVANIQNIQDGLNQVAIVMSDVAYDAINGTGKFENGKVDLHAIAGMYPNVVQIVTTKSSGVQTIADLKGKRVGVGKVGSGVEQSASKVFEAAGLTYDDMEQVTHTGYADSVQEMKNGNLDAAFFTSGVPNSNITDLQQSMDIQFVNIDGDIASSLLTKYPFYQTHEIPIGDDAKYNLEHAVQTVAIKNMLIVSPGLSEDAVYEMTNMFYDYLGSDAVSVGALKQFDRETMQEDLVVPLHPGAEKFYGEK